MLHDQETATESPKQWVHSCDCTHEKVHFKLFSTFELNNYGLDAGHKPRNVLNSGWDKCLWGQRNLDHSIPILSPLPKSKEFNSFPIPNQPKVCFPEGLRIHLCKGPHVTFCPGYCSFGILSIAPISTWKCPGLTSHIIALSLGFLGVEKGNKKLKLAKQHLLYGNGFFPYIALSLENGVGKNMGKMRKKV